MKFDIKTEKEIPYYEETQKRSIIQKIKKIKNTILFLIAYAFPSKGVRVRLHKWRGVNIGKNVYIGIFVFLDNLYPDYIYLEDNCSINTGSLILTHFNPMKKFAPIMKAKVAPVVIKEGAIVSAKSTILPGVTVGKNSIISAGSVVEKNISDYTIARGNPAKAILEYEILLNNK